MFGVLENESTLFNAVHYVIAGQVKSCSQEELMNHKSLEMLKQLPTKEYVRLWSSPTRYVVKEQEQTKPQQQARQQSPAEMSECSSDISSSASTTTANANAAAGSKEAAPMVPPAPHPPGPRTKPWALNTKNLKVRYQIYLYAFKPLSGFIFGRFFRCF